MKQAEIVVGGLYRARISGNLVTVRVDEAIEPGYRGKTFTARSRCGCTNLKTGKKLRLTAAKLRRVVTPAEAALEGRPH
jgi:hypothetical protein